MSSRSAGPGAGRGRARGGDSRRSVRAAGLGGERVEGRQAVRELLAAGRRPVREVWLAEGADQAPILDEIASLAEAAGARLVTVSRARLAAAATTGAPQGVLAWAGPLAETPLEELVAGSAGGSVGEAAFLLVVDGVSDPHNLGALLRSAECAGATGVILPRHRSAHLTATVAKAAAGAVEHLRFAVVPGVPNALSALAAAGVWTVGLDAGASSSLWSLALAAEPVALVVGAEGHGLSRLARQRCDVLVAIPQRGAIASLNVATAGALGLFEVSLRRA